MHWCGSPLWTLSREFASSLAMRRAYWHLSGNCPLSWKSFYESKSSAGVQILNNNRTLSAEEAFGAEQAPEPEPDGNEL